MKNRGMAAVYKGDWARAVRAAGLNTVQGAFACDEGEDLHKPGLGIRRRTRLSLTGEGGACWQAYLKRYGAEPPARQLLRRLTGGYSCPAHAELSAVRAVRQAGVPTMEAMACGFDGNLLGATRGYILVSAVPGESLERCGQAFLEYHAGSPERVEQLTTALAALVRRLHAAGLVHRDLYASHVFLHEEGESIRLHLIDLARVFRPRLRRFRWRVKDLAQLHYSMPPKWVRDHWQAFLERYLPEATAGERGRWRAAIERKSERIRRRDERKARRASA